MRRRPQSQAPGLLLLAVWIAALLACLWLGGCGQRPQSQVSVRSGQSTWAIVYRIGFPILEAGVLFALDWLRPADAALVAEPVEEVSL